MIAYGKRVKFYIILKGYNLSDKGLFRRFGERTRGYVLESICKDGLQSTYWGEC